MLRTEWESLRRHDVCILLTIRSKLDKRNFHYDKSIPFNEQFGIDCIRGCEIDGMLNDEVGWWDGVYVEEKLFFHRKPSCILPKARYPDIGLCGDKPREILDKTLIFMQVFTLIIKSIFR